LQYASATGTGNLGANSGQLTELSGSIPPGRYFLVQPFSQAAVGAPLPAPDLVDSSPINMSGTAGKVTLVDGTATLGCNGGSAPRNATQQARIIDLVGYGNANFFEGGGAAPTLSNQNVAFRQGGGCQNNDSNSADFTAARFRCGGGACSSRPPLPARQNRRISAKEQRESAGLY
jgi:hypothetical protein